MRQFWAGVCAFAVLSACGDGNPFTGTTTAPDAAAGITIPDAVQGNVGSFTYDPATGTLTVTSLELDTDVLDGADSLAGVYTRATQFDRGDYLAYTRQDTPTERHVTAFVKQVDNTRAGIFVTGGQFGTYFGGGLYQRDGGFQPATGKVQYGGDYVGLTNFARVPVAPAEPNDLRPVTTPTPVALRPSQAAEVTGTILITADFVDNEVEGGIANRVRGDTGDALEDIFLSATAIDANGSFSGNVEQAGNTRGTFGGIFGGTDSRVIAGSLFATNHVSTLADEEEHGVFVLVQCGTAGASPICP